MSGRRRADASPPLSLRRVTQTVDINAINQAFHQIEESDATNVKRGREPYFPSLLLAAPNGATYRVSIALAGDGTPSLALKVIER